MPGPGEFRAILDRIGLPQYFDLLYSNGFEDWDTLLEIKESDMDTLGFRIGHKRKLQRAIASHRGLNPLLPLTGTDPQAAPSDSGGFLKRVNLDTEEASTKRRYRRHPKPDPNAPKKPKRAYMNFSDYVRKDPIVAAMSFVEIARIVGKRWQELDTEERVRKWEKPAEQAMLEYETAMEQYKTTDDYLRHQAYLEDFRAKHSQSGTGGGSGGGGGGGGGGSGLDKLLSSPSASGKGTVVNSPQSPDDISTASEYPAESSGSFYAVDQAVGELSALLHGPNTDLQTFSSILLPPQNFTRIAVDAFLNGTGTLFFTYSRREAENLLNQIYFPPSKDIDSFAVLDVFAMAAVGSYYDTVNVPVKLRRSLYFSCLRILTEMASADFLRCMRLFLCLVLYCTLNKSLSAKRLIAAAVQIGHAILVQRENIHTTIFQPETELYWKRVFRSVVFVECWLCYSLGHRSIVTSQDIDYIYPVVSQVPSSVLEDLQDQTSRVGILAADICRDVSASEWPSGQVIRHHTDKLNQWHQKLPRHMHLATLNSQSSGTYTSVQRRSLMLVHLLYLGAVTLLHRDLLIAIAQYKLNSVWELDISPSEVTSQVDYCIVAASQAAHIARLLQTEGTLPKHCWIFIYQSSSACSVLLYSASQNLLHRKHGTVKNDLDYVLICIEALVWCGEVEEVANKYVQVIQPIYNILVHFFESANISSGGVGQDESFSPVGTSTSYSLTYYQPSVSTSSHSSSQEQIQTPSIQSGTGTPNQGGGKEWPEPSQEPPSRIRVEVLPIARDIIQLLLDPFGSVDAGVGKTAPTSIRESASSMPPPNQRSTWWD